MRPEGHREKEKWVPPHHTGKPVKNVKNTFSRRILVQYKYRMHLNFVHGHILSRFHKKLRKLRYGADFQKKVRKKR